MGFLVIVTYLFLGVLAQQELAVRPNIVLTPTEAEDYWRRDGSQRPCTKPEHCKATGTDPGANLDDRYVGAYCDTELGKLTLASNPSVQLKDVPREPAADGITSFTGICVACPNTLNCAQAFAAGLIKSQSDCTAFCELDAGNDGTVDNLVLCSIEDYQEDCNVGVGEENAVFCNAPVNDDSKTGYCTACRVVDTNLVGESVQANDYPIFTNNNVRFNTVYRCELEEYDSVLDNALPTSLKLDGDALDTSTAMPLADMQKSTVCLTHGSETPCCDIPGGQAMCEGGSTESGVLTGLIGPSSTYDYELEQCGGRKCGDGSAKFPEVGMCYLDPGTTDTDACWAIGTTADVSKLETRIAGVCQDGYCSVTSHINPHACPPGMTISTEKVAMQGCSSSGTPKSTSNLQGQILYTLGQNDEPGIFGHQNEAVYCQSDSTLVTTGTNSAGVNALFSTYYFDVYQTHQAIDIMFVYNTNQGARFKTTRGRCIVGMEEQEHAMFTSTTSNNNRAGPHMTTPTNCVISDGGYYTYKGMQITWAIVKLKDGKRDDSCTLEQTGGNRCDGVETVLLIPVQTRSLLQVAGCPSDGDNTSSLSKICRGDINCDFSTDWPCGHEFHTCDTPPPTPSSTGHGDPIIWTFDDECYDLHQDGLYKATAHPNYDHSVHVAVYNDYMREVQVRGQNGEILLAINTLGMVENNYPHFLYEKERECPPDLYDCVDTFMEYAFDAQDFRYIVQILHHNYKDPALEDGEYGYHLDVKPQPYARFEQHRDGYSGLYFENPLPELDNYCVGGSKK